MIRVDQFTKRVPTSEDWLPSYAGTAGGREVEVSLCIPTQGMLNSWTGYPPAFVVVHGGDDFGMTKEFTGNELEALRDALDLFHRLTYKQQDLTIEKCRNLGMNTI